MIATLTRSTLNGVPSTPTPPSAVFPPDQATDVTPSSGGNYLYWLPYTDIYACPRVTSRLYFGTDTNPPLVAPALPGTSFHVGVLEPATTYYWRVEFHLAPSGTILAGPLWQFTTSGICPQTCETSPPACPVVCLFTTDNTLADICSEAISGEFTRSYSCLNTGVGGTASFDRTTGYVAALAGTRGECPAVLSDVVSADRFWLVGPESSEPIAFTARIDFEGQNFPDGALREGAGDVEWVGGGQHSIALQHVPGNAFILRYGVKATADGGRDPAPGSVFGQLTFPGLPDGYTIASCAGYATPVPIQPASWSSMKELFR
jgi:hypothetical protein